MKKEQEEFERLLEAFQQAQERDDVEEEEAIGIQCLCLVSQEAEEKPSESLRLIMEAHEHENSAQWDQAEATYKRALALAEAEGNSAMVYKRHDDLSSLYTMRNMPVRALEEALLALQAARQAPLVLAMALDGAARCYLAVKDLASAIHAVDELLQMIPAEKMYDTRRVRALVLRAQCSVAQGEVESAQKDLDTAWPILAPQAHVRFFAGIQSCLAAWWETTAQINTSEKNTARAAQAMGKAVEFRRTVSQLPQLEGPSKYYSLVRSLQRYSIILLAANEIKAAIEAFEESRAIQHQFGLTIHSTWDVP